MVQTLQRYPIKPLECWAKMKELRRAHHVHNEQTANSGGMVAVGIIEEFQPLMAGFGEYASWQYEPRFTKMVRSFDENVANLELLETRGYPKDLCSSLKLHLGGVYRGHLTEALEGRKPDFVFQWELCPFTMKMVQSVVEHLGGVPIVTLDLPFRYGYQSPDLQYMVDQFHIAIEEIEGITGKKFQDELFLRALELDWETSALWSRICVLNQAVPAPLDYRMLTSLRIPLILDRDKPHILEFYRTVYDEVKQRVDEGISARGVETARLLWDDFIPFFPEGQKLLRYPEAYGAVLVGGSLPFVSFGVWDVTPDGSWVPSKTPKERGWDVRTREDGLWSMADRYLGGEGVIRATQVTCRPMSKGDEVLAQVRDWKADGVILGLERRCRPSSLGGLSRMAEIQRAGVPAVDIDPSTADPRELNIPAALKTLDAFMEGMGLRPIGESRSAGAAPAGDGNE